MLLSLELAVAGGFLLEFLDDELTSLVILLSSSTAGRATPSTYSSTLGILMLGHQAVPEKQYYIVIGNTTYTGVHCSTYI